MDHLIYLNKPLRTKLRPMPRTFRTQPRSRFAAPIPPATNPLPPDPGVAPGMMDLPLEISFVKLYKQCVDLLENEKKNSHSFTRETSEDSLDSRYEDDVKKYKQEYPDLQVMRRGVPKVDLMLELDYTVNKF